MQRILLAICLVFLPLLAGGGTVTQDSIFWPTSGVGDGVSTGYSSDQWQWFNRMTWLNDPATQGVALGYLNNLAVTTPGGALLRVASGGAVVYGFPYRNTQSLDLVLATPVINTTGYRVVLRADWAAQTVRVALLQSADGVAAIPDVTQTAGVTWEISLATGTVTVVPAVGITDARAYFEPGFLVDHTHLANRTRRWIIPAVACRNQTDGTDVERAAQTGWPMIDSKLVVGYGDFYVPDDFVSDMKIRAIVKGGGTGNAYLENYIAYGADGEVWTQHSDTFGFAQVAIPNLNWHEVAEVLLVDASIGDILSPRLSRDAVDVLDTLGASMQHKGWVVEYTADM